MDLCTQCGAGLGIGRFCTNCGHPVSARDEAAPGWIPETGDARGKPPHHRDERRVVPWLAGLILLAALGSVGLWMLLDPDDEPSRAVGATAAPTPTGERSSDPPAEPDPEPSATQRPTPSRAEPVDLAAVTTVKAPAPAPAGQDSSGNPVSYVATNMTDAIDETTWRMPGDGTGESITFRLEAPAILSEVGLINGYAKVGEDSDGFLDWYAGNRRVLEVEWIFDDGTVVTQPLRESAAVQSIPVDDVETESVTLRLVEVSDPGAGRDSRDYTAISEVSLVGVAIS